MICPNCGDDNQPGAKFCAQCGDALELTCPVCSFHSPLGANFCSNCGHAFTAEERPRPGEDVTRYVPPELLTKINAARATNVMRGERRTVTMLFADIQGSTAAAEGLDPEDWTEIINGAFEHLIAPVYRYEGTLARLLGDAILAFFGAPIAHEDDPIRAVRAGLEIVDVMGPYKTEIARRWNIPIDIRVGINTGLVVVGEVGSDLRVEYTALGDAVNVAARMEQTAEPGTVRVTSDTWALVSGHFAGQAIGPVDVKGKSEPVEAIRVLDWEGAGGPGGDARPLVGRAEEIGQLLGLLGRLGEGSGWVASILGEAGLGKSSLVDEFRRRGDAADDVAWLVSASESYDSSVPLAAVRQLLTRWWGLTGATDPYAVIESRVAELMAEDGDVAAYLGHAASVPLPPTSASFIAGLEAPVLDERARQAIVSYLEAEARRRPVIAVFEDIHWADPISLTVIEALLGVTERAPLGVLFTMRPYRDEAAWHVHEVAARQYPHRYSSLDLTSLGGAESERLFDSLTEGLAIPPEQRARILARADGNPLFLDQMARSLMDGGANPGDVVVPTGIASLLTARLDRLATDAKNAAQVAAVIGLDFDRETLAVLLGESVATVEPRIVELLRRGIVVERPGQAGLLGFNHALMQEAAYSTMLLRARRELHDRLGRHLTEVRPDAVADIARNFVEARDMGRAFPYLVAAAEEAARAMALSDAIRLFTMALDNIPADADPDLVIRAHDGLGVAYTLVPDLTHSEATYQRLVDYADRSDRPSAKVTALNRMAMNTFMLSGDAATARGYLDDAYALAQRTGDEAGMAEYHLNACAIAGLGGEVEATIEHDVETTRWGEQLGLEAMRVEGLTRLALNASLIMDFDAATKALQEAREAALSSGDSDHLALLDVTASARLAMRDGDNRRALEVLLAAAEPLDRVASFYAPMGHIVAAYHLVESGRFEEAITHLQQVRQGSSPVASFRAVACAGLAQVFALLGMNDRAEGFVAEAMDAFDSPLGAFIGSTMWADLVFAHLALGEVDAAEAAAGRGLDASSSSKYWERPRLLIGRAHARLASGDVAGADTALDEAETFLLGKGVHAYDSQLGLARSEALLAGGKATEARSRLAAAAEVAEDSGYRLVRMEIEQAAARAATALGDDEAAEGHRAHVRRIVAELAAETQDAALKRAVEGLLSDRSHRT